MISHALIRTVEEKELKNDDVVVFRRDRDKNERGRVRVGENEREKCDSVRPQRYAMPLLDKGCDVCCMMVVDATLANEKFLFCEK